MPKLPKRGAGRRARREREELLLALTILRRERSRQAALIRRLHDDRRIDAALIARLHTQLREAHLVCDALRSPLPGWRQSSPLPQLALVQGDE